MATLKLYLDTRASGPDAPAPIKIVLSMKGTTTTHSLGIKVLPEQWDEKACKIIKHPHRQNLNIFLTARMNQWSNAMLKVIDSGAAKKAKSVSALKKLILDTMNPDDSTSGKANLFYSRFVKFKNSRRANGTKEVYERTMAKMEQYDPMIKSRTFEDIDKEWLRDFELFLEKTNRSANARAIHFRNIRSVFNDAIDDEVTAFYPFRKFKIRTQETAKRSLTVDELRTLKDYPCEDYQEIYRDMFMLGFYLCGINPVDLFTAPKSALVNGRLEYTRAKTGRLYSIKVEDEAMQLIDKYKGRKYLLNIMDDRKEYKDFLHRMDKALKQIGPVERKGLGGKKLRRPLFPKLSQYWCRHTWATIASQLDIPEDTIRAALGHGKKTTTDIYINFDNTKVDKANRRIIDFVLYGKQ